MVGGEEGFLFMRGGDPPALRGGGGRKRKEEGAKRTKSPAFGRKGFESLDIQELDSERQDSDPTIREMSAIA